VEEMGVERRSRRQVENGVRKENLVVLYAYQRKKD
jgi:hypothetical protein